MDIKARDWPGHLYNIEMQMYGSAIFLHRMFYYWAVLQEGREKGLQVNRIHLCQRLLKTTLTAKEELLALSLDELQAKGKALEKLLGLTES